jgi:hypothetical protein
MKQEYSKDKSMTIVVLTGLLLYAMWFSLWHFSPNHNQITESTHASPTPEIELSLSTAL